MDSIVPVTDMLEAVIEALDRPRDRLGRLVVDGQCGERLRKLAIYYNIGGAEDKIDQAVKVIRAWLEAA